MLKLDDDETVTQILPVDEFSEDKFIFMATRNGVVKKTNLNLFHKKYKSGIKAIRLDDDDKLVGTVITDGDNDILLSSYSGKLIRFHESKVRPMGRTAIGVKGITLKDGMKVISLMIGDSSKTILCLSENGFGKRTKLEDFPSYTRGGQGVIALKTSDRNGNMVSAISVDENDGIMLISDKGTLIRTAAAASADGIIITKSSVDLYNPKTVRASAGAIFRIPIVCSVRPSDCLKAFKDKSISSVGLSPNGEMSYLDFDFSTPFVVLLGNESSGLDDETLAQVNQTVRIEMGLGVESLNVSNAASVVLFEARRQRHQLGSD